MISRCFHTKNTTCKQSRCHDQVKIITKPSSSDVVASLVSGIWTEHLGHNSITLWLNHRWLNSRTNMINDLSWFTAVNMPVWDSQKTPKKELEKIPIACAWYVCQCMLLNASNTLAALNDILKYLEPKNKETKTQLPHINMYIYIYTVYIYTLWKGGSGWKFLDDIFEFRLGSLTVFFRPCFRIPTISDLQLGDMMNKFTTDFY